MSVIAYLRKNKRLTIPESWRTTVDRWMAAHVSLDGPEKNPQNPDAIP